MLALGAEAGSWWEERGRSQVAASGAVPFDPSLCLSISCVGSAWLSCSLGLPAWPVEEGRSVLGALSGAWGSFRPRGDLICHQGQRLYPGGSRDRLS